MWDDGGGPSLEAPVVGARALPAKADRTWNEENLMRTISVVVAAGMAVFLTLSTAAPGEAQLGRLGRAVKDRIASPADGASAGTPGAAQAPTSAGRTRGAGFTAGQLDGFAQGLSAEVERRGTLAGEIEALQPRPDYDQCSMGFVTSPAGQAALEAYNEAVMAYSADPQNPKNLELLESAQQTYANSVRKACGPSPDEAPRMIKERQSEPARLGAERAGLDVLGYARLKELVLPFCVMADEFEAGREAAIPSGAGKSFSYSAEDTALLKPRCAELLPLLQAAG